MFEIILSRYFTSPVAKYEDQFMSFNAGDIGVIV